MIIITIIIIIPEIRIEFIIVNRFYQKYLLHHKWGHRSMEFDSKYHHEDMWYVMLQSIFHKILDIQGKLAFQQEHFYHREPNLDEIPI